MGHVSISSLESAVSYTAVGEEHPSPTGNPLAVKKPAAAGEEHPPLAVNAPVVKGGPAAAGEGHSSVKQPPEATGKKPAEDHPARTEERHAKQSAAPGRLHQWRLSPLRSSTA
ncbi:hypothetical protein BHE74_00053688 [Ensete ventricosum]|nr:hypothetical protein GW17_00056420 [Ensete ventricosum]RWW40864.1 hypothetical protein BHE74_00053688 [Ensete ventricosum]